MIWIGTNSFVRNIIYEVFRKGDGLFFCANKYKQMKEYGKYFRRLFTNMKRRRFKMHLQGLIFNNKHPKYIVLFGEQRLPKWKETQ